MFFASTVTLLAFASSSYAEINVRHVSFAPRSSEPERFPDIPRAHHVVELTVKSSPSQRKRSLDTLLERKADSGFLSTLFSTIFDEAYVAPVSIGNQKFDLLIDAASSDIWVPGKGFQCYGLDGSPQPQSVCGFNSAGFDESASPTYTTYAEHNYNMTFVTSEFVAGHVGFDTISIAGVTVPFQEFGVGTSTGWDGAGVNASGIFGLAYPALTAVFKGQDPHQDSGANWEGYLPFFFNAVAQKKVAHPYFSISIDRGVLKDELAGNHDHPNHGYLAFGGISPVPVTSNSVTVPVQGYAVTPVKSRPRGGGYFYYTVDIDSYAFPGSDSLVTRSNNTYLNAGNIVTILPNEVAAAFNARFVPPAVYLPTQFLYQVDCNATVPAFAVTIGGKTFPMDPRDAIIPSYNIDANGKRLCISSVQAGGEASAGAIFSLGGSFLRNVVTTFNIQWNEITITQRQTY